MQLRKKKKIKNILFELFMIALILLLFYPVLMIFFMSLKDDMEILLSPLSLPKSFQFDNYVKAFEQMDFIRVFCNSLFITTISVVVGTIVYCISAYALVRARKHRWVFMVMYVIFLLGLVLPAQSTLIPLLYLYKEMGLMNTYRGIVLLYLSGGAPFSIFLLTGFINTVPITLEEAASLDGCTPYGIFFKIVLPLLKPIISTLVIINAVNIWNDFLNPLMFMSGKAGRTITLAVYMFKGQYSTQWNVLFAGLVLATLPMMIVYFVLQKYMIAGMTTGAVKS